MSGVLLISDNSDGNNWGCYATSRELRKQINNEVEIKQSIFLSELRRNYYDFNRPSLPDIKYVISEYLRILTDSGRFAKRVYIHGIEATKHFFDLIPKTAEQFEPKSSQFLRSKMFYELLPLINEVDHVLINGEGSIHGNRRKSQFLLFLAYLTSTVFEIPTHVVNHTLQIDTPRLQKTVNLVYPKLDTIAFRDPISVEQYKSKIGKGNIVAAADAAWLFDDFITKDRLNNLLHSGGLSLWSPTSEAHFNFKNKYICVGGGSGFSQGVGKLADGFEILVRKIRSKLPDYNILLTAAASSDETFMLKVSERTGCPLLKLNNDVRVAASVISHSDLYVGGRWHPTIFALLGNAQIISFKGNTFKIDSIKEQLGSSHPVYRTKKLFESPDEVTNSIATGIQTGFEHVPLSQSEITQLRSDARKNVNSIYK